jgi:hypothetical protein
MKIPNGFASDLRYDIFNAISLWRKNGSMSASIMIRKEVHYPVGKEKQIVFFVYNYIDPSRTIPDTGCRVNKKPITSLSHAIRLARKHEAAARASGKWVDTEGVRQPSPRKAKSNIWSFADLSRRRKISYAELRETLENCVNSGASIIGQVVVDIALRIKLMDNERREIVRLAKVGENNQRFDRERKEYRYVALRMSVLATE